MLKKTESMRDRLIQEEFWDTGMRVAELVNQRVKDINFKTCKGTIREGKGGKSRSFTLDF